MGFYGISHLRVGVLRKRKPELLEMQMEYARLEDKAFRAQKNHSCHGW